MFILCCSFYKRRERSRDPKSIIDECKQLVVDGYKESPTRSNVDSYLWYGGGPKKDFNKLNLLEKEKAPILQNF